MISKEEVEHIAKLARLELTGREVEKMQKDLSEILDYFNLLKKAPKPKQAKNKNADLSATRKDEIVNAENREKLIEAAHDKKDDYIKVKAIF